MGTVEVRAIRLSAEKLKALPVRERYVFALVGHIFNDIMGLMRLTEACKPNPDSHDFHQRSGLGLLTQVFRMLIGKSFEAVDTLKRHSIDRHLRAHYFVKADHQEAWDDVLAQFDRMKWLRELRNQNAFHYMRAGQWAEGLDEQLCNGADVLMGRRIGDTFFHWSDTVASHQMLSHVNADDPVKGLETLLAEMQGLLLPFTYALAEGAKHYMQKQLLDPGAFGEFVQLDAPRVATMHVPYFFEE